MEKEGARLREIQHEVDVDYVFTISDIGSWQQFPDMAIEFDLKYSQFVEIKYNIQLYTKLYIVTRVMVDGSESRKFRQTTGNFEWHSNSIADKVWLEKGKHKIKVEYRLHADSGKVNVYPLSDWQLAYFSVSYLELA